MFSVHLSSYFFSSIFFLFSSSFYVFFHVLSCFSIFLPSSFVFLRIYMCFPFSSSCSPSAFEYWVLASLFTGVWGWSELSQSLKEAVGERRKRRGALNLRPLDIAGKNRLSNLLQTIYRIFMAKKRGR